MNVPKQIILIGWLAIAGAQPPATTKPPAPAKPPADVYIGVPGGVNGGVIGGVPGGIADGIPKTFTFGPDAFAGLDQLSRNHPKIRALDGAGTFGLSKDFAFAFAQPGRGGEDGQYDRGQRALDRRRWDEAVQAFTDAAGRGGSRADGALYWKAYAENKLGKQADALATIGELRKNHPKSRWLDDAGALEIEIKGGKGVDASDQDEELKLMALNSIMHSDPERAVPILEKMLGSSQSPKVKERALFVLTQSGSPKARDVVVQIAKGKGNPDLQLKAVHYLAIMGGGKELADVYAATSDPAVKRAVLRAYLMTGGKDQLLQVAKSERDPALRREAVRQLGAMGAQREISELYQVEGDIDLKREMIRSMFISGDPDKLMALAKGEKEMTLRKEAIRSLGVMGKKTGDALASLYAGETDKDVRKEIIKGLFIQQNAAALVQLARGEKDPELKKEIVERLSHMKSKEATDYMMELLK
jgi:HEAT repeat protein